MFRPERSFESDEEEILYSDEDVQSESKSEEEEEEWGIDWDDVECVDEYGDDRDKDATKKMSEEPSSEEEFDDLQLDAVDELNEGSTARELREKEGRSRSEDDKNESEEKEEEGDPWSRWVGIDYGQEERKDKEEERRERGEKKEGNHKEVKRDQSRREETKPTLAELVLRGKVSGGVATRDKRSRLVGRRSPPRGRSPVRRKSPSRNSPPRRVPSPVRRSTTRKDSPRRDDRRRGVSPLRRKRSTSTDRRHPTSPPMRKDRRVSPRDDRRRDRSPRRIPSPAIERRRNPSPVRKERPHSPSRRVDRSPDRRGGDPPRIPSPSHGRLTKRERSPLLSKRHALPRMSSPNRTRRSRSPVGVGRETHPKVSSPNRVKIGERSLMRKESSPRRDERQTTTISPIIVSRKEIPSLLDVKIIPTLSSRMEGRVAREEEKKEEEKRAKVRIERREEKEHQKRETKETKEEEKKEERKRHIPIVWNDKESDVTKKYRSIGHVEGIEVIERKKEVEKMEERNKEKKGEEMRVAAHIPLSMMARVGKCHMTEQRSTVIPSKGEVGQGKSHELSSKSVPSLQNVQTGKKSVESAVPLLQPTEVVRIITNNDVVIRQSEQSKERGMRQILEEEEEEEEVEEIEVDDEEDEEESGWLSASLQEGVNGMHMDRGERKTLDPSSAALRLFGRATASAVTSSTMRDAKPIVTKEVRSTGNRSGLFGEKGGKRMNIQQKRRLEGRIEMRSLQDTNVAASRRRRPKAKIGVKEKVSQSGPHRLLEAYF